MTSQKKVCVEGYSICYLFKTLSIRILSNFNFQWTKTLYQNNFKYIAFFFTLYEILYEITPKKIFLWEPKKQTSKASNFTKWSLTHDEFICVFLNSCVFSRALIRDCLWRYILALEKCKIECDNALSILEINRYLALTSYCNTIGQSNNALSILGFSLAGKRRVHVLIFSSIG